MSVLYIIGASAPPVRQLDQACKHAIEGGWQPHVILTPTAAEWVDLDAIRAITGTPIRVNPRLPHEQDPFPRPTPCSPRPSRSTRSTSGPPASVTPSRSGAQFLDQDELVAKGADGAHGPVVDERATRRR